VLQAAGAGGHSHGGDLAGHIQLLVRVRTWWCSAPDGIGEIGEGR
jgi:hypothetical protein